MAAWTIAIMRCAMYGEVLPRLAIGVTATMAFSSQSVMTFAQAATAMPNASEVPMMAAAAKRCSEWTIDPRMRSSMILRRRTAECDCRRRMARSIVASMSGAPTRKSNGRGRDT